MAQAEILDLRLFKAKKIVEDGKFHISQGDLDTAVDALQKSVETSETAEGLTYLGWVLSLKGQVDQAIDLCKRAVNVDPTYGNPYNDIGSYLIYKNQLEEAIPWLEQAKTKVNYEPKHFPYINLGRVYSVLGRIDEAIHEFRTALTLVPHHKEVEKVLEQLENLKKS